MMKYLFFFAILFPFISQASVSLVGKGHVANVPIEMNLVVSEKGEVTGSYHYTKTKIPIDLKGKLIEREITLKTVNDPKINEVFKGSVITFEGEISRISGKWFGTHGGYGDNSEGYDFKIDGRTNPLQDRNLTCEEMKEVPELAFELSDLGSGYGTRNSVDYECPKSLSQLDFLQKVIRQASGIRRPSRLPQHCTGTIVHAQWRYYHFDLAKLGYYPQGFSSRRGKKKGMEYFEEWSYHSLYNREIYTEYMAELKKIRPLLTDWYIETHAIDRNLAQKYTENALERISNYGFGSYFYSWKPEELVPFTEKATNGVYDDFLLSINDASEGEKTNSLRRLLIHNTNNEVVKKLAFSVHTPSPGGRSEPMLAYAVYNPSHIKTLLDAGFSPNQQNEFGKTALYYAIQFSQHDSVSLLLNNGANVNHTYQLEKENKWSCIGIERWGRTPLMHAAQHSDVRMIKLLLEAGADLHAKDVKGSSAIDYAKDNLKKENEKILSKELELNPF
ncbi:ankyrin repeat domain-containing protein [Tamilnaduibacter salinus]|uniref:Uncharacterized protein n=2 Tax=Tamilnaduibacter salinus TaxID=1484056 RepID=A0A2A2HZG1_9GAMM|nr:ankyrin repeat domain-containing protein [Tamilnaduibacter salinus]PAV24702.1 hypothetical protein CF392_14755 [Tamilnaduibacter salinus]